MNSGAALETVELSYPIVIDFVLYSLLMIGIGVYFWRKNKTSEDYFIGDKGMGPVVSALSAGASDMSGWLLMGLPGAIYLCGIGESYIAIGLSVGALLNWLFVAKRLRVYTDVKKDCITIPDYFETRFEDSTHILRIICAIVILIFFTIYISSGLVGGAKLFESLFSIKYEHALTTGTILIVIYTFMGGYKAVCWTDLIQGLLMMLALVVVPCVMLSEIGGINEAIKTIEQISISKDSNYLSMSAGLTSIGVISSLAWGLGYFGQPHILVRFMSIKSTRDIPTATFVGIFWMVVSLLGAIMLGFLGIAYFAKTNTPLNDPERIFIVMSQLLFNPWISGVLLSAILAAIMSTASSQLLVSGSTLAEDFYRKILNREAKPKFVMLFSRISVLIVAIVAFFISRDKDASILSIVSYAWAGFGASFGSVLIVSLFWKNTSKLGAILGMSFGAISVLIWENIYRFFGLSSKAELANLVANSQASEIWLLYSIIPGFCIGVLFIILGSFIQKTNISTKSSFDEVLNKLK